MTILFKNINARGGQSNNVGSKLAADYAAQYKTPLAARAWVYEENRIFLAGYSNNESTFTYASTTADLQAGFELSEYYTSINLNDLSTTELSMVKMGIGGTKLAQDAGLVDWSATSVGEYLDIWKDRIRSKITYEIKRDIFTGKTPFYRVDIDWNQGEEDANSVSNSANYRANFEALKTEVDDVIIEVFALYSIPTNKYKITWYWLELNQLKTGNENAIRTGMFRLASERSDIILKPTDHLPEDDVNRVHYSVDGYTQGGIEFANLKHQIHTRSAIEEYPLVVMLGDQDCLGLGTLASFNNIYTTPTPFGFIYYDTHQRMLFLKNGYNAGQTNSQGGFEMSLNYQLRQNNDRSFIYKRGVNNASSSSYTKGQSNYNFPLSRIFLAARQVVAHGFKPKIYIVTFLGRNDTGSNITNYQTTMQAIFNNLKADINAELALMDDRGYSPVEFILPYVRFPTVSQTPVNASIDALVAANTDVTLFDTLSLDISGSDYSIAGYEAGGVALANLIGTI